jgi:hypothetical protein
MGEDRLVVVLTARWRPHTIPMYGSRARGDATPDSDWDVCCVAAIAAVEHHGWIEDGAFLDVFVYPGLVHPGPEDLRMLGSRVLLDERGLAAPYLAELRALEARGPTPMPSHQRAMGTTWIAKMTARGRRGLDDPADFEAHYRRHWLLKDLLEYAFTLRDRWYGGPKLALATLRREEPALWALFEAALVPDAPFVGVARLAEAVAALGRGGGGRDG